MAAREGALELVFVLRRGGEGGEAGRRVRLGVEVTPIRVMTSEVRRRTSRLRLAAVVVTALVRRDKSDGAGCRVALVRR